AGGGGGGPRRITERRPSPTKKKATKTPKDTRPPLPRRALHSRRNPPEIPTTGLVSPRLKRGGLFRRSAPAAGLTSRTQASKASFSVTLTDRSRPEADNLQA